MDQAGSETRLNFYPTFDALRLLAAFFVFWAHQHSLLGLPDLAISNIGSIGTLGVLIFFAISGYLNAQSMLKSRSFQHFMWRRILRIYPAQIVCVLFCLALGAVVTSATAFEYWRHTIDFTWRNMVLFLGVRHDLTGVFLDNPLPKAVNGSIWTLPHEVRIYFFFALACLACRFRPRAILAAGIIGIVGFCAWCLLIAPLQATNYIAVFAITFAAGAILALVECLWSFRLGLAALVALAALLLLAGPSAALLPVITAAAIILGRMPSPSWTQPPIDISYGAYIYAFPVQQLVASYHLPFWPSLAWALALTVGLAILSAIFIERPFLRRRRPAATFAPIATVA